MRNLTKVSLENKALVWYFIILIFISGIFSYYRLGRMEDPSFTIHQMVVTAAWPGADAKKMEENVTEKIEKKLQDLKGLDYVKSYSKEGKAVIYVNLKDDVKKDEIKKAWQEVRNMVNDMKPTLPQGVIGPFYNDHFDDVYGTIYAISGEDYSYKELEDRAKKLQKILWAIPSVNKVELIGNQKENIYIELDGNKLATLKVTPNDIVNAISKTYKNLPAGSIDLAGEKIYLSLDTNLSKENDLSNLLINVKGATLPLSSIASIKKEDKEDTPKFFYDGEKSIAIAISMEEGGNILDLGKNLDLAVTKFRETLPLGMEINPVVEQGKVVNGAISEFIKSLGEAIVIVLAVSFLSLGTRTGMVVALCIPLVIAGTFLGMDILGIDLHKVSLGALIISLGLLVDDAIIAVEMMTVKLEEGLNRFDAACFAYTATAKPMLTGTLITCCGFIPVAFSDGLASEFCKALFPVISMALILSWLCSVMVAPLYGYHLIKIKEDKIKKDPYGGKFYSLFKNILIWCLEKRKIVILGTALVFVVSLGMFKFIPKEFFPPSVRPELIIDLQMPEGTSLKNTEEISKRLASYLNREDVKDDYVNYTYYAGEGAPRFVLSFNPHPPDDNFAQFVITAKDLEARDKLKNNLEAILNKEFPEAISNTSYLQMGPPANYPVMISVRGEDISAVKDIAKEINQVMQSDSNIYNINYNWMNKSKTVKLVLDQEKIRSMGLSNEDVAKMLYSQLDGVAAAESYAGGDVVNMTLRLKKDDRDTFTKLNSIPINLGQLGYVPLMDVAHIEYDMTDGVIWRRDLKPAITVQGNIYEGTANDATKNIFDKLITIRENLPQGYEILPEGAMENSQKAMEYLKVPLPMMFVAIMTILMFQLKNIQLVIITLLTAPLGIIGVSFGLFIFQKPLGFVAILGILALFGMIIRNSIILIDQIKQHIKEGEDPYNAIIDSTILRFRPIMLTALAAILGMIPLVPSNLWGSMAISVSCGLLVATILTLLILPTIYASWFKIYKN